MTTPHAPRTLGGVTLAGVIIWKRASYSERYGWL
jgi:hypothetical protein